MIASVRKHMDWPIVMLTDETTEAQDVDEVVRFPCRGQIAKDHIEALKGFEHDETVHLDTDLIVKGDVRHVFDQPFDVALTWRVASMRYNSGVMFSRSHDFWVKCSEWFEGKGDRTAEWTGEQRAVNDVAETGEFNVLELPCDTYNWSPCKERQEREQALIWHYKGARKKWMR